MPAESPQFPNKSVSTIASRQAADGAVRLLARRRKPFPGLRRPFLPDPDSVASSGATGSFFTVRDLGHVRAVGRGRRAAGRGSFPFPLPRRQQLLLLDLPELRHELARRQRIFLTELAGNIMSVGFGHNATARLLRVSPSRLCAWFQAYSRLGRDGLAGSQRVASPMRPAPCKVVIYLTL